MGPKISDERFEGEKIASLAVLDNVEIASMEVEEKVG